MKVVILAGGFGTRIAEESHLKPKPMIEIGNMPILWHIMKYYSYFGFNEFIICCGYKANIIKEFFANYYLHGSDVTFDFSKNGDVVIHNNISEPWKVTVIDTGLHTQTGGRIKRIQKYINEDIFLITYGDGVCNVNLDELIKRHEDSDNVLTITSIRPQGRFGVLDIDNHNNVVGFNEKSIEDSNWINGGYMVASKKVFDYIKDDTTVFELLPMQNIAKSKKLGVYKHFGFWQCMDTQRDRILLEDLWNQGQALWKVWE